MAAESIQVDVVYPESSQVQQVLTLTGTVEAVQNAALASLQSGVVKSLYVEIGDKVTKGQPLMALDAKLANLNLGAISSIG